MEHHLIYKLNLQLHLTINWLDTITKNIIKNAIDYIYLVGIHTLQHGFGQCCTINIFEWLYGTYSKISAAELKNNSIRVSTPVNPLQPIIAIFVQIEEFQCIATAGGTPLNNTQIVKAAETLILANEQYNSKYCK